MHSPLQITFRNLPPSDAVEAKVRQQFEKLAALCDRIQSCRVVVDAPHQHQYKGNLYQVTIDISVPNEKIVVNREPSAHQAHENCYVAVRDAFSAARRQVKAYVERHRNHVKTHQVPPHGRIVELYPDEGYGFIAPPDGGDAIYFHANSLLNGDAENLQIGDEVRFAVEQGQKGPQASTVQVIGKHHIVG
jgi:cold shock CspA family protein/ribosome-associated translation inhibitor RaiA